MKINDRLRQFVNANIYHIYNRGVAKNKIFKKESDYQRLINTFSYYLDQEIKTKFSETSKKKLEEILESPPKKPRVEILTYCLMPNHFHLILRQIKEKGISLFMKDSLNSYCRYFNTKYDRVGTIFQGRFKAVEVETDEQLTHLSRYIHLNPLASSISEQPDKYLWSSYHQYLNKTQTRICKTGFVLDYFKSMQAFKEFNRDYINHLKEIETINNLLIE